jgi:hypothetical protein
MFISSPLQSETQLNYAQSLIDSFDAHKDEFRNIAGCSLNLPKMHAIQHYLDNIREYGVPSNYDTELTEHLHIQFAKIPYKMTNRRDMEPQMLRAIHRQSAIQAKYQYLESIEQPTSNLESIESLGLTSTPRICAISINNASRQYQLNDLEVDLRIFLHNGMYPEGEGRRHRVKKRNLPKLDNIEVSFSP